MSLERENSRVSIFVLECLCLSPNPSAKALIPKLVILGGEQSLMNELHVFVTEGNELAPVAPSVWPQYGTFSEQEADPWQTRSLLVCSLLSFCN